MRQATKTDEEITRELKAYARKVANELPERLLKGEKISHKSSYRKRGSGTPDYIEQSYDHLDGEWHDWLEVAKRYEHRVPNQDRYDIRHTIMLELNRARQRDGKPIPLLRAYRIASLTVALYWRRLKRQPTILSLDQPTTDYEGNENRLLDTVADDKAIQAIDIDSRLDASQWL
ncbi:unnamed protein product, partial [marine sediment metagenome]